jgi:hypothetical protein
MLHITRSARPIRLAVIAAVAGTAALALGSPARADASTQLINAGTVEFGPPTLALEVGFDSRVFIRPSNPRSFQQQWDKEPEGNGRSRYRNRATNACLIVPATTNPGDDLRVGPCGGVGARNLWTRKSVVPGNGAFMLVSAHSGQVPLPNFFGVPSDLMKLTTESNAASVGSLAEYIGA